uniref:Novel immune-type receptor 1f n=1 Tax=Fundulus heteroclitus TaxID=8078 RepID=A0A3Q2QZB7_FUNHE
YYHNLICCGMFFLFYVIVVDNETTAYHNVTLNCFYTSSAKHLSWYKQVPGEPPQIISSFYKSLADSNIFHKQFKDSKRLSVSTGDGLYNLKISNVQSSDSALYYCSFTLITVTEFAKGTFLLLKSKTIKLTLEPTYSVSVQQGGSVTLNCSMLTGSINGEHSVYWFRKTSRGSHLGTLYTTSSGGKCVRSPESSSLMHSCVYSLPKRNVSVSDAGTYHCAVASCGQILFGEGTRLNVEVLHVFKYYFLILFLPFCLIFFEGSHQQPEHVVDTQVSL